MEIASREIRIFEIIHYNDGCTKTTQIYKHYIAKKKKLKLESRFKFVIFKFPNGKIDKKRSYDDFKIIDKSEEFDNEYTNLDIQKSTTIHYNDGCTIKTKIHEVYTDNMKTPMLRYKIVRFILPNGTIDKKRSYLNSMIDKSEKFDTEQVNCLEPCFYTQRRTV